MKRILILLLIVTIAVSCKSRKNSDIPEENEFFIKGKLTNSRLDTLILSELTTEGIMPIDTTFVNENGEFLFRVMPKEIGFFIIGKEKHNFATLLAKKGEVIDFKADALKIGETYTISGSEGSELLRQLYAHKRQCYQRIDSLRQVFLSKQYEPDFLNVKHSLDSTYADIFKERKQYVKNFIETNNKSLVSILGLYEYFKNEPLFSEKADFEVFQNLSRNLYELYPNSTHVLELHKKVTEINKRKIEKEIALKNVAIGMPAPEISYKNPENTVVSLSSLKGKVVLIDFWASWYHPSRLIAADYNTLYKKYRAKGFEIYSVSLDENWQDWTNAINKDKRSWINVSELKKWQSGVVKQYQVEVIPFNILIDAERTIVAKDLKIADLYIKLAELIKPTARKIKDSIPQ